MIAASSIMLLKQKKNCYASFVCQFGAHLEGSVIDLNGAATS